MRARIKRWYQSNGRELPWRNTGDPYRVWVSEIMLQQTTVTAVVPYYRRFLARFPTIRSLAIADEAEVLRLWEGLGYYRRARHLHRAAQDCLSRLHGTLPSSVEKLQKLTGIGRYTAGAIASFGFDTRAPIVEANTLRLYSRLLDYRGDPRSCSGQKSLWHFAEKILPRKSVGEFNQALIDLGATVCTDSTPDCKHCPLKRDCRAFQNGTQNEIPRRAKREKVISVHEATFVVRKKGKVLLEQQPKNGWWAGLWDFPRLKIGGKMTKHVSCDRKLIADFATRTGIEIDTVEPLIRIRHSVTKYRITLHCYSADYSLGKLSRKTTLKWVGKKMLDELPLSTTGRKLANLIHNR